MGVHINTFEIDFLNDLGCTFVMTGSIFRFPPRGRVGISLNFLARPREFHSIFLPEPGNFTLSSPMVGHFT